MQACSSASMTLDLSRITALPSAESPGTKKSPANDISLGVFVVMWRLCTDLHWCGRDVGACQALVQSQDAQSARVRA